MSRKKNKTMSNTINIKACDNELFLIAYPPNGADSYILAHVKSGNNYGVAVTVNILSGDYNDVQTVNGLSGPVNTTYTAYLPEGIYTVVAVCVNWGGPWEYSYNLNGGPNYIDGNSSGVGAIQTGPGLTIA